MIYLNGAELAVIKFPSSELHIRLSDEECKKLEHKHGQVQVKFESNDDLIALVLLDDLLNKLDVRYQLSIPYFPSSRQDRCEIKGEPASLQVYADMINKLKNCYQVIIEDPHSPATVLAITKPLSVLNLDELPITGVVISDLEASYIDNVIVVCPDKGAIDRSTRMVSKLRASMPNTEIQLLQADKVRDYDTGNITGIELTNTIKWTPTSRFLVVDDICEGGRTFIELLKIIYKDYPLATADLLVTHGFFSKGINVLSEAGYNQVYFANDMRK